MKSKIGLFFVVLTVLVLLVIFVFPDDKWQDTPQKALSICADDPMQEDGVLEIDMDKMVPTAQKMLAEIVRVQLSKDFATGEKYVLDNFVWTDEMEIISHKLKEIDKSLNGTLKTPLADKLLME